jgi:glycerophosphoryl diester phosphodiesterase
MLMNRGKPGAIKRNDPAMDSKKKSMGMKRVAACFVFLSIFYFFTASPEDKAAIYGRSSQASGAVVQEAPRLIAHAGGEIHGIRLTNSLQALDKSYTKGFRFFELDMDWTSDGVPVLVHDWGNLNWFLNIRHSSQPLAFHEFKAAEAILDLQFMDLDSLEAWGLSHPDARIVTDVKSENTRMLGIIKEKYPFLFEHILPQIYQFEEYDDTKALGYNDIILTLYRLQAKEGEIIAFCRMHPLFGVTMYSENVSGNLLQELNNLGIKSYIHTVNAYNDYVKFRENGAYGVYTDYFEPGNWVE